MIEPSPQDTGISFWRVDLFSSDQQNKLIIPATLDSVYNTHRCTTLSDKTGQHTVVLVEHILAALAGMGIDNALVKVHGPEVPILDGSCLEFCKLIKDAGVIQQESEKHYISLDSSDQLNITVCVDFSFWNRHIGVQYANMFGLSCFEEEIAPARTFALLDEIQELQEHGILRGCRESNTILIDKNEFVALPNMRFSNEIARHKLLDVIGDLALIGRPILGRLDLDRPGHRKNIELAKSLLTSKAELTI
jgi:UDP-3-O-acyl N-acetylglucosamine deacetylase